MDWFRLGINTAASLYMRMVTLLVNHMYKCVHNFRIFLYKVLQNSFIINESEFLECTGKLKLVQLLTTMVVSVVLLAMDRNFPSLDVKLKDYNNLLL